MSTVQVIKKMITFIYPKKLNINQMHLFYVGVKICNELLNKLKYLNVEDFGYPIE